MVEGILEFLIGSNMWQAKDLVYLVVLAFNLGGIVWLAQNHFHEVKKTLSEIKETLEELREALSEMRERVAHLEGRLDRDQDSRSYKE